MPSKSKPVPPQYTIYFAKSDELKHVDFVSLGLVKKEGASLRFRRRAVDLYTFSTDGGATATVGFTCGPMQGHAFYYDFVAYVSSCHKHHNYRGVAMCGICAGNPSTVAAGDVCVGTKSKLLQGKLKSDRFEEVKLDPVTDGTSKHTGLTDSKKFTSVAPNAVQFTAHTGTYLQSPFVLESDLRSLFSRQSNADRKLIAIDMESWFCLNAQNQLETEYSFPVIKGVSDFGSAKSDEFHHQAVNNSVQVALDIFRQDMEVQAKPQLKPSTSFTPAPSRKRKAAKKQMLSWTVVQELLSDKQFAGDLALLDRALHTETHEKLGQRRLLAYQKLLSTEGFSILSKAIDGTSITKQTKLDDTTAADASDMECDDESE